MLMTSCFHIFGKISQYLQLPNTNRYTDKSFRRSSATLVIETGADILMLNRHVGCKFIYVAETKFTK